MKHLALDIGGAHIKAAHSDGSMRCVPFAVWKQPERLSATLSEVLSALPRASVLGVTTTAELCDCYESRRSGVLEILGAVEAAARTRSSDMQVRIWRTDGRLSSVEEAREDPRRVAAANWLALATFVAELLPAGRHLLADMGSTTVDLIPIVDSRPRPHGMNDTERLISGELVYTGLRRTPVFGLVTELPFRGHACPVIPELFATTLDARVVLGDLPENPTECFTADGRPATRDASRSRLARTIGTDAERFTQSDAEEVARAIVESQESRISAGLERVASQLGEKPLSVMISGEGESVLNRAIEKQWPESERHLLSERIGPEASQVACAHALLKILEKKAEKGSA